VIDWLEFNGAFDKLGHITHLQLQTLNCLEEKLGFNKGKTLRTICEHKAVDKKQQTCTPV